MMKYGQNKLDSALENLYSVFSKYCFNAQMPCCIPHCMDQLELDILGQKALRDLTAKELQPFASHVLLTCGESKDFQFVLPRLLELVAQHQWEFPDYETILGKLSSADWFNWQLEEKEAIEVFLQTWWQLELQQNNDPETVFAAICCTQINPRDFLVLWRDVQPVTLASFVNRHLTMIALGKGFNSFVPKNVIPSILQFLQEPETRIAFEKAFYQVSNAVDLEALSLAEQLLA